MQKLFSGANRRGLYQNSLPHISVLAPLDGLIKSCRELQFLYLRDWTQKLMDGSSMENLYLLKLAILFIVAYQGHCKKVTLC